MIRITLTTLVLLFLPIRVMALEAADNLQADATAKPEAVFVLLFSTQDCVYCEQLKREVLHPLQQQVKPGTVIMREISMDLQHPLVDFDGASIKGGQLAKRYQADFSPTLVFTDSKGQIQSQSLVGYNTPEFFSFYVERAIRQTLASY